MMCVRSHRRSGKLHVWTVLFSEVTCGPPPTVPHAKAETTGSRYLDRATYTCESGYYSDGPQNHLVCGNRTKWEGDVIVCRGNPVCISLCVRVFIVIRNYIDLTVHKYEGLVCMGLGGWVDTDEKGQKYKLNKIRSDSLSEKKIKNAKMQVNK